MAPPERLTIRTPAGERLTATYHRPRDRWRIEPGGYERRDLKDALAQATGASGNAAWIVSIVERIASRKRDVARSVGIAAAIFASFG